MIKKFTGLAASVVALASVAQAEVKIDDYLSLDGYATGSATVVEGTTAKDKQLLGGGRVWDSALFALNGKYENFTARVSLLAVDSYRQCPSYPRCWFARWLCYLQAG
jgi:opacity protein-like surface antigen